LRSLNAFFSREKALCFYLTGEEYSVLRYTVTIRTHAVVSNVFHFKTVDNFLPATFCLSILYVAQELDEQANLMPLLTSYVARSNPKSLGYIKLNSIRLELATVGELWPKTGRV
jgi:hypothetical protein